MNPNPNTNSAHDCYESMIKSDEIKREGNRDEPLNTELTIVSSKSRADADVFQEALRIFKQKITCYIERCMYDAGYEVINEEDVVQLLTVAVPRQEQALSHKKMRFSFDRKQHHAIKLFTQHYPILIIDCMIESDLVKKDEITDSFTQVKVYQQFKTLASDFLSRERILLINPQKINISSNNSHENRILNQKLKDADVTLIHDSPSFRTYAYVENSQTFILKIPSKYDFAITSFDNGNKNNNYKIDHEHEMCNMVNHYNIRKSLKQNHFRSNGLLMEFAKGVSLTECCNKTSRFSVRQFLSVAKEITLGLVALHNERIVHTNLTTDHIIVDIDTNQASIIGLRLSSKLALDNNCLNNYNHHDYNQERNIKFISPEQSGWISRRVDFRSDLYSLGSIFYYMLVGRLPFKSESELQTIQLHLGLTPSSLKSIDKSIPTSISAMVSKLLEKNGDNRYQSAKGLVYDIELILSSFQEQKFMCNDNELQTFADDWRSSEEITLGEHDNSQEFYLSQRLYGRKEEFSILSSAFQRISNDGTFEIITITGSGGSGKTFFVEQVIEEVAAKNGLFIRGKFMKPNSSSKQQHNEPYSALLKAIENFCAILLRGDKSTLSFFKARIQKALRQEAKLLTDVIPNLDLIIGNQLQVTQAGGKETENRFHCLFCRFIRAICSSRHPVVLLLDDMHWADSDSLELLTMLSHDKCTKYLLMVNVRREEGSALNNLQAIQSSTHIKLNDLEFDDVNAMMSDVLKKPSTGATFPLSAFVYDKTKGNVFFIMQILLQFIEEKLLKFCCDTYSWEWDANYLKELSISDHVIPHLVKKMLRLEEQTLNFVKILSCIGIDYPLSILNIISGGDRTILQNAVAEGLLVTSATQQERYRFAHDYIQQVVHSLIPVDERKSTCFFIAKQLWDKSSYNERSEYLFIVTNLFNSSMEMINEPHDIRNVLKLNLMSGQKAKESSAFRHAVEYFGTAIELLPSDRWNEEYELSLALFNSTADVAYCLGDFSLMDKIIENILRHAKCTMDKLDCYSLKMRSLYLRRMEDKAVECGLHALECLGEKISLKPITDILPEIEEIKVALSDFHLESFKKTLEDPYKLAALSILSEMGLVFYVGMPKFLPVIVSRMMQITLKYGLSSYAPSAFAQFGAMLCIHFEEKKEVLKYKEISLQLLKSNADKQVESTTYLVIYTLINHWFEHISSTIEPLGKAYKIGRESGSNDTAFAAAFAYFYNSFLGSNQLLELYDEMKEMSEDLPIKYVGFASLYETVEKFLDIAPNERMIISGASSSYVATSNKNRFTRNFQCILESCYFYEYEVAAPLIEESETLHREFYIGSCQYQFFVFYSGLIAISMAKKYQGQPQWLRIANRNLNRLNSWSKIEPMNYQNKAILLQAEIESVHENFLQAEDLFKTAISLSSKSNFINEAALANERFGIFCIENSLEERSYPYFTEALRLYTMWGAVAKLQQINSCFSKYLSVEGVNLACVKIISSGDAINDDESDLSNSIGLISL